MWRTELAYAAIDGALYTVSNQLWVRAAKAWLKPIGTQNGIPMYKIDAHSVQWREKLPPVLMCAFDATNDFLYHILGTRMSESDRRWYVMSPYTDSDGLQEMYTITTLDALVAPYDLGVSRIRFRSGYVPTGELSRWVRALGCNPSDLITLSTTYESFVEEHGGTGSIDGMRVDHGDEPLRPSVVFSHNHASYLAPRDVAPKEWILALQFGREPIARTERPTVTGQKPPVYEPDFTTHEIVRPATALRATLEVI